MTQKERGPGGARQYTVLGKDGGPFEEQAIANVITDLARTDPQLAELLRSRLKAGRPRRQHLPGLWSSCVECGAASMMSGVDAIRIRDPVQINLTETWRGLNIR